MRNWITLLVIALGAGCTSPPTKVPIDALYYPVAASRSSTLVVLLPGAGDTLEMFARRGFVEELQKRKLPVTAVAVGAYWKYYKERIFVTRLREDVIKPAQARGFTDIWLVGISLGGWGSLLYAGEHGEDLAGVIALAPFLGSEKVLREVDQAGGLAAWEPASVQPGDDQRLALWLKRYQPGRALPEVYFGYGEQDRFARPIALLTEGFPPNYVISIPGGHNWRTWIKLWRRLLDRGVLNQPNAGRE